MLRIVAITALVLAGVSPLARADVFRWVDKDGIVHYSDEWVPGSELIKGVGKPRPDSNSASRSATAFNSRPPGAEDLENSRAVQQDVARAHAAQCKFARERYMKSIESRRIYKEGKDGEREYVSDAEADAYREEARKDVQAACGSVPEWKPDQPIPEPKVKPQEATSP